jgi:2,3-bisphosphoglycerate-independent phosphoglycerate mutase
MTTKPITILVILDGLGISTHTEFNAVFHANTPHFDAFLTHYPHALLQASGAAVGLPAGYIGNSEVGHVTIGAGRIIQQPLTRINHAIEDGSFFTNTQLTHALQMLAQTKKTLHIMGLLSDAGVHSHEKHLYAFIKSAVNYDVETVIIHPFLDGRDVPPQSAATYLQRLEKIIQDYPHVRIGSLHGRFYAMDRDHNWNRTDASYRALTQMDTRHYATWQAVLEHYYHKQITDEFIPPTQLTGMQPIQSDDVVIFFNFRPDRARQLTASFVEQNFTEFPTKSLSLAAFITPVSYGTAYKTVVLFATKPIHNTLKEVLARHGKKIFSIAETEKYAHVTYFFNGENEQVLPNETQILIPSLKTKNYIQHPCMSAPKITNHVLNSLRKDPADFYLINYANADMVGHSGDFDATVKAIECLDNELGKIFTYISNMNATMFITADHGNAEYKYDKKVHQPHTAHTTNPVPFIMIEKELKDSKYTLALTQLADIAPFILNYMGLPVPKEMD